MKFHDLAEKSLGVETAKSSSKKKYYPSLHLAAKQVPEIDDYDLGDTIMFHIEAVVVSESKREGEPRNLGIEMRKAAVANLKKIREEADEKGLPMKEMKDLDKFRRGLKKKT